MNKDREINTKAFKICYNNWYSGDNKQFMGDVKTLNLDMEGSVE